MVDPPGHHLLRVGLGLLPALGFAVAGPLAAQALPPGLNQSVPDPTQALPDPGSGGDSAAVALAPPTLSEWADRSWNLLADRSAATDGAFSRQGVLLRFDSGFDAEYALDYVSSRFDPWEDARWAARDNGVRYWSGSINHLVMIDGAQARVRAPLGGRWSVGVGYDRETNPALDRDLLRARLAWGGPRGLHAFAGASFQAEKPDRDLAVGVGWRSPAADARLELHALDVFSNVIYNGLGVDPDFSDVAVDYDGAPLGLRAATRIGGPGELAVSLEAGVQLPTTLRLYEQEAPERGFVQHEDFVMVGLSADYPVVPRLRIGGLATLLRAERERTPLPDGSPEDAFALTEETIAVGVQARALPWASVEIRGMALRSWRPERRTIRPGGTGAPVDYLDRAWSGQVRVEHRTTRHLRLRGAWDFDFREVVRGEGEVPSLESLDRNNHRARLEAAWVRGGRIEIALGVRFDTDGDRYLDRGPFDGGHGRLVIYW